MNAASGVKRVWGLRIEDLEKSLLGVSGYCEKSNLPTAKKKPPEKFRRFLFDGLNVLIVY